MPGWQRIPRAEGYVNEPDVAVALADQLKIPFWDPTTTPISPLVEGIVPAEPAAKHMVVGGADGDSLLVAKGQPSRRECDCGAEPGHRMEHRIVPPREPMWRPRWTTTCPAPYDGADYPGPAETPRLLHVNQILAKVVEVQGLRPSLDRRPPTDGTP